MASTPTRNSARRSSRINASVTAVKAAVSPRIKASVNNVKDAVSPKIKASLTSFKAAVSPSKIMESCRRVTRRTATPTQNKRDERKELENKSPILSNKEFLTKLGPEEVKQQLGKCGTLDILRSRLVKINKCGNKVKDFKKDMEAVETAHQENNNYEISKPIISKEIKEKMVKKEVKKDPAHERYMLLAAKPDESLVLPAKHKVLNDYFRSVDTVISLLHNRKEIATYSKVQYAVQEMMKKGFSQDILAKINTVCPEAYSFRQDKTKTLHGSFEYNLVVTPNFQNKDTTSTYIKFTSAILSERRNIFQNTLIKIIKVHHDKFVESLDQPSVNKDKLKRWHPEFDMEEIPDIDLSELPQPPETEKFDNAVDVLSKAMDMFSLGANESNTMPISEPKQDEESAPPKVNSALKGVSSSLLEKIRAREAAKASQSALSKTKTQTEELQMLKRLPEVARILRNTFITERKVALPWEMLVSKVSATFNSTIYDRDVDNHLNSLVKEAPGWLTVVKVSSGTYLKINRNMDVNDVIKALQILLKSKQ